MTGSMAGWLVRRSAQAALVVLAMTVIVFVGLHVAGNPVDILVPPEADAAERARIAASFGLDQPLWRQYLLFVARALQGDLGRSFIYNQPALALVAERLPATLELSLAALVLAAGLGIGLGLYAGLRPRAAAARLIMAGSVVGLSLPGFWVGLMLVIGFSVRLGWLPSSGRGETVAVLGVGWSFLTADGLAHLILPAANLALFKLALILRLTRAGVREVVHLDYVRFARARGLAPSRVVGVHILRAILIPIVTVIGLEFCSTVAFSMVTESIFAWPGMGRLMVESIHVLDRPVIVAYLVAVVLLFVAVNLLADILYRLLDPRVGTAGAGSGA
ncbi:ABC transporter, permease protein 1 (cluster 5, nickel/peptides/opines) [Azospirillum argentinense]|uniref:ABC transporter permease n=1 Tax=Azospirillum argentinense TaxID=2970906 RepID=UPI0032DF92C0